MESIAGKHIQSNFGRIDQDTFKLIFKDYHQVLYRKFLFLVGFQNVAEDIVQDVFLRTWQLRHTIHQEKSLGSYMFRIGHNLIMDYYRKQKIERSFAGIYAYSIDAVDQIDEEWIFREDKFSKLEGIINKLPPKRKQIFEMCKLERKSYEEVSALLHISPPR